MSCELSAKTLGEQVVRFVRRRHPTKTAANIAAETGLGEKQIKAWLEGRAAPGSVAILRLIATYGPEFQSEIMPVHLSWLDNAVMQAREDALLSEIEARQKQLAELRMRL